MDISSLSATIVQVSNVSAFATVDEIKKLFSYLGEIRDIKMYPSDDNSMNSHTQFRVCYVKYTHSWSATVAQFLTNTVFLDRALIVKPIPDNCIPTEEKIMLDFWNPAPALPALGLLSTDLINNVEAVEGKLLISTVDPNLSVLSLPQYPALPATLDPNTIEEIRRTVYIGNLNPNVTADQLLRFVNQIIGEVKYVRMAGGDKHSEKCAFVEFSERTSVIKALQSDGVLFDGRQLKINHSTTAIVKPNPKTPVVKEIEEAMKRVREAEGLITATVEPEIAGAKKKSRRRSRSRSRSRHRHRSSSRKSRHSNSVSRRSGRSRSISRRSRRSPSISRRSRRSRSISRRSRHSPSASRRSRRSRSVSRRSRHRSRSAKKETVNPSATKETSRSRARDSSKTRQKSRSRSRSASRKHRRSGSRERRSKSKLRHRSRSRSRHSGRSKSHRSHSKTRKTSELSTEKVSKKSSSKERQHDVKSHSPPMPKASKLKEVEFPDVPKPDHSASDILSIEGNENSGTVKEEMGPEWKLITSIDKCSDQDQLHIRESNVLTYVKCPEPNLQSKQNEVDNNTEDIDSDIQKINANLEITEDVLANSSDVNHTVSLQDNFISTGELDIKPNEEIDQVKASKDLDERLKDPLKKSSHHSTRSYRHRSRSKTRSRSHSLSPKHRRSAGSSKKVRRSKSRSRSRSLSLRRRGSEGSKKKGKRSKTRSRSPSLRSRHRKRGGSRSRSRSRRRRGISRRHRSKSMSSDTTRSSVDSRK